MLRSCAHSRGSQVVRARPAARRTWTSSPQRHGAPSAEVLEALLASSARDNRSVNSSATSCEPLQVRVCMAARAEEEFLPSRSASGSGQSDTSATSSGAHGGQKKDWSPLQQLLRLECVSLDSAPFDLDADHPRVVNSSNLRRDSPQRGCWASGLLPLR